MEQINRRLARLRIAHKLVLCGVFFALPIAILLSSVTAQHNQGIETCQTEVRGTRLLEVCPGLLRDLDQLASPAGAGADSGATRRRIIDAVSTLASGEGGAGKELGERLAGLARQLEAGGVETGPAGQAALAARMRETATQLVPAIWDDYGLILDSELHTYYLMNLTGPLLLQSQTALAAARSVAAKAAQNRGFEASDFSPLEAECGALSSTILPRQRYSLETALREEKRLHGAGSSFTKNVPPLFERYVGLIAELSAAAQRLASSAGTVADAGRLAQVAAAAEDAGVVLGETGARELRTLLDERIAASRRARLAALLMSLACVGLAAGVMTVVVRNITGPLERAAKLTASIAAGKVKDAFEQLQNGEWREFGASDARGGPTRTRDEVWGLIGSLSVMTASLNSLLAKVTKTCQQAAGGATQAAAAVRQLEATISEQAASTNQVSATSKEIYANVQEFARTMESVMGMASDAAHTASAGVSKLEGIRAGHRGIARIKRRDGKTLETINEKTGNIDKVITTITRVANRTNLLSLNAAIEAEKAGGKAGGFAVVALEVRRLADQTAVAALDIERQIHEMQRTVREGVAKVEAFAQQTQLSSVAVAELSAGLSEVIEGTTRLGPQFETVNSGMQMQSQGAGPDCGSHGEPGGVGGPDPHLGGGVSAGGG